MASEEGGDGDGGLWGSVLGTAGAALIGGIGNYMGQKDTNEQNLTLGREQMQFQERMSNTSYQRAIKDMEAAGINPMLATKLGGASTPPGSMPQVGNAIGAGISGAQQGAAIIGEAQRIGQTQATTDQLRAQTEKIKSETLEKNLNSALAEWQLEKLKGESKKSAYEGHSAEATFDAKNAGRGKTTTAFEAEADKIKSEAEKVKLGLEGAKAEADFYKSEIGKDSPLTRHILTILKGVTSAFSAAR